jgi:GNAT superfamily N-acetyltransferase
MSEIDTNWQIDLDASDEDAYTALDGDRVWNAFAIADLEPPFRAYSRIAVARRLGTDQVATCLVIQTPDFSVVVPYGEPTGVAAILASVELPTTAGVLVLPEHEEAVDCWYDFPRGRSLMIRMATDDYRFLEVRPAPGLVRLHPPDLKELLDLYTNYPGNHFVPIQIEHGVYFGVRENNRLVAAGGTHVLAPKYGIATLGGIFTLPEARGRGYASSVTSALVAELLGRGCRDVALNVYADNDIAQRVYARLGFYDHCQYETGDGVLRDGIVAQHSSSQV